MKILALETSTDHCSLALWMDGEIVVRSLPAQERHSQFVLPLLQTLLDEIKIDLKNLDGIAFGAGPGSFTGLRIACGVAQGLALGANLPVVPVSDLMAIAESANRPKVIAILDARMGEIYHAAYEKTGDKWLVMSPPCLCLPSAAPKLTGDNWSGVGSGFLAYQNVLAERYLGNITDFHPDVVPHAKDIAILGVQQFLDGEGLDPADARPVYIRDKVAQTTAERNKT